jgi:serine/threonine protein kinase
MFGRGNLFGRKGPQQVNTLRTHSVATDRYFVQGQGQVQLGRTEFKAQGGEGAVYVKGQTAYKLYTDPARCIAQAKIDELSLLVQPNIIRPVHLILDGTNTAVGYTMRAVGKAHSLCQLFPKAFRQRNNITPEITLRLVRQLQTGVLHIHSRGVLVVDLNEMNFLVSTDFAELFFIDVDSYQTPSFPATALMETVRDRHATAHTTGSDWFAFAVVSFQMFVGIHPFKGTYGPLQHLPDNAAKLEARMRGNISVLHAGVTVPAACLPLAVIPQSYLDWYRAVFEQGQRVPPPQSVQAAIPLAAARMARTVASHSFEITEIHEFDSEIIWHDGVITVTEQSVYFDGKKYARPSFDAKFAITPRQRHLIGAYDDGTKLRFEDLTVGRRIETTIEGEQIMLSHGQLYIKQHESIFAIDFVELPNNLSLGIKAVANVMINSTRMFDGVAIQNLLGTNYVSIPTASGGCHQVRLAELDGAQIVNAKLYRRVLMVVVTTSGRYDKYIFRFAKDFSSYDLRRLVDVATTDIEFTVLDTGVVLHLTDDDELEIFSSAKESAKLSLLDDPALKDELKLFHKGTQALLGKGRKLYKFRLVSQT